MEQGTTLKTQITNYKAKLDGAIRKREQLEREHFAIEREVDLLIKVVMNLESINKIGE